MNKDQNRVPHHDPEDPPRIYKEIAAIAIAFVALIFGFQIGECTNRPTPAPDPTVLDSERIPPPFTSNEFLLPDALKLPAAAPALGQKYQALANLVQSISEIPPDFACCGPSSHQNFLWFSRYCPPRIVTNRAGAITQLPTVYFLALPPQPRPSHVYADIYPAGGNALVDSDDIIHAVNLLSASSPTSPCTAADIFPCPPTGPNGVTDAEDLIAVLQAFQGNPLCPGPYENPPTEPITPHRTPMEPTTGRP